MKRALALSLAFASFAGCVLEYSWDITSGVKGPSPDVLDSGEDAVVTDTGSEADVAAPEASTSTETTFYAACLTELANDPDLVLNFFAVMRSNNLEVFPLSTSGQKPPLNVSRADAVGPGQLSVTRQVVGNRVTYAMGTLTIPGAANPISGDDIVIRNAVLVLLTGPARPCASMAGTIEQPTTVEGDLDPTKNTCVLVPIKDADPRPKLALPDFPMPCQ